MKGGIEVPLAVPCRLGQDSQYSNHVEAARQPSNECKRSEADDTVVDDMATPAGSSEDVKIDGVLSDDAEHTSTPRPSDVNNVLVHNSAPPVIEEEEFCDVKDLSSGLDDCDVILQERQESRRRRLDDWVLAQIEQQRSPVGLDCVEAGQESPSTILNLSSVSTDSPVVFASASLYSRIHAFLSDTATSTIELDEQEVLASRMLDGAIRPQGSIMSNPDDQNSRCCTKAVNGSSIESDLPVSPSACGTEAGDEPSDLCYTIETILGGAQGKGTGTDDSCFIVQSRNTCRATTANPESITSIVTRTRNARTESVRQHTTLSSSTGNNHFAGRGAEDHSETHQSRGSKRPSSRQDERNVSSKRIQTGKGSSGDPQTSGEPSPRLPCIIWNQGCHGKDTHLSDMLRKIESHEIYICGRCYEMFPNKFQRRDHKDDECERQCVLSECDQSQLSSSDSDSIIAIKHKRDKNCRSRGKDRPIQRWRYIYALCNPDCNNVPESTVVHDFKTPHNGIITATSRPVLRRDACPPLQEREEARQLLREAQTALVESQARVNALTEQVERVRKESNADRLAERAEYILERERAANTIDTLQGLLRLCREHVTSEELRNWIDDKCPP
ncbi:uncharacterized protein RHO25_007593 [Cercospora beticola]|uniref:C2H2-type domain-containing protein n=1 Tax=Cercospora beticola TaxID=122368 RepID=A0ABZ0NTY1_CERBT|nr:hypothetical protein RHO25_007593 [Cercospora beticola]